MSKISRWFNSKTGKRTVAGVLALALVVAILGQLVNWWDLIPGAGTVILPPTPEPYPAPVGGYTCLPTCNETDGKFLSMPGEDMASFGGEKIVVWISVPADYPSFELSIFDGDSGRDNVGNIKLASGNWDNTTTESTYTLYADPLKNGQGQAAPLGQWRGNQDAMPNNAWYTISLNNAPAAKSPNGHYFYRLEATRPVAGSGINAFKLRSNAYLSTGMADLVNANFAIVGMMGTTPDIYILYPQYQNSRNPGPSTYTGDWQFHFYLPNAIRTLELWDGDFDRGTSATLEADTDDPNTEGVPAWASSAANPEGVGGKGTGIGAPADNSRSAVYLRAPAVIYSIVDPAGQPIYVNNEPSGTEEWENFVLSTDSAIAADGYVNAIQPGFYTWHIEGLDVHNTVWIRTNYELVPICPDNKPCAPPPVWPEGNCPRTIGYWKNNVSKILAGRTSGVQESKETLEWALKNVAAASPLYRSGLNATLMNPEPIANAVPLTLKEAEQILQRDKKNYPGDWQSMLARALQQNLATWMNLGSGKIGPTTVVRLNVKGGVFEGTLMDALKEAQTIILNATGPNDPLLERAKDIGDQINNGLLGENASDSACTDYKTVIPPDKQPPKYKDMPKAPKPTEPPAPVPVPVCTIPDLHLAGDYAIVALNPADCQGQQNGLLFHGTSLTQIDGTAYSNGCVRAVGTTNVQVTAPVDYVLDQFGNMSLISAGVRQIPALDPATWEVSPPNCADPAAIQMDGKDFKGNMNLAPGLYCISGDTTINNKEVVVGEGVTLYFTDGKLTINGGATVQLSAPNAGASPALPGVLIYVPQTNSNPLKINGNSDSFFNGVIYAPASEIEVLGTGFVLGYNAQFIGWDVRVGGTADVIIGLQSDGQHICR